MFDDFWTGYNYGRTPDGQLQGRSYVKQSPSTQQEYVQYRKNKIIQQMKPGVYDKSKLIKMQGPSGEQGEVYANGKMYIINPGGKAQVRTFPSRPFAIKYMQARGWVLI